MDLNALLYAIGATGFFASRAFVPAFFTAFMMRYGDNLPFLGDLAFLQTSGQAPTWFTSNWTILGLGFLAICEVLSTKSPEAQEILEGFHKYAKSIMAALTVLGVLGSTDTEFIEHTVPIVQASMLDTGLGAIVAGAVYALNMLRTAVVSLVLEADPDGELGIQSLVSWFEDLWASFGIFFMFIYPIVMVALVGVVIGILALIRQYRIYKEEKSKIPCEQCGKLIYPSALICPHCRAHQSTPRQIGFFGDSLAEPIEDRVLAAAQLAEKRRCPACATRLKQRSPTQQCPTCGTQPFADAAMLDMYTSDVAARLPKVLVVSLLLSLVPVLGLIPGVIYYRMSVVAPFRSYIPAGQGLLLKWALRLLFILLVAMQIVPGLGGFSVPIMALLSFTVYRTAFVAKLS